MPTVYRKCTHALIQRAIGDEYVLLNTQSGNVHQLNPSATCIWRRMADDMGIEAIAAVLVENFAIDAETALADAQSFVTELSKFDLLEKTE